MTDDYPKIPITEEDMDIDIAGNFESYQHLILYFTGFNTSEGRKNLEALKSQIITEHQIVEKIKKKISRIENDLHLLLGLSLKQKPFSITSCTILDLSEEDQQHNDVILKRIQELNEQKWLLQQLIEGKP